MFPIMAATVALLASYAIIISTGSYKNSAVLRHNKRINEQVSNTALVGLATLAGAAQADPARPMLVVGIVVDQLRTDYIEGLQSRFSEHGFRYLIKDGVYFRDVDFKVSPLDAASATAMLYTGSYPAQTGVPSASVFEQSLLRASVPSRSCFCGNGQQRLVHSRESAALHCG